MTNTEIIMKHSLALAAAGKIANTTQVIGYTEDGQPVYMPEAIHTFAAWKAEGFSVKKGSKAVATFPIWKHKSHRVEIENPDTGETEEHETGHMFMVNAAFFSASQVERITA